jgi:hypothetical protein
MGRAGIQPRPAAVGRRQRLVDGVGERSGMGGEALVVAGNSTGRTAHRASAALVVVLVWVVVGTLTGPLGRLSAARLAVVPAAAGSGADLPPAGGQREADLRRERRIVSAEVGEKGVLAPPCHDDAILLEPVGKVEAGFVRCPWLGCQMDQHSACRRWATWALGSGKVTGQPLTKSPWMPVHPAGASDTSCGCPGCLCRDQVRRKHPADVRADRRPPMPDEPGHAGSAEWRGRA